MGASSSVWIWELAAPPGGGASHKWVDFWEASCQEASPGSAKVQAPHVTPPGEEGKVLPGMLGQLFFSKRNAAAKKLFSGDISRPKDAATGVPSRSRVTWSLPGEVEESKRLLMSTEDMPGSTQPCTLGSGRFSAMC